MTHTRIREDQECEGCQRTHVFIRLVDMNTDEESEPIEFFMCLDCVPER